MECVCEGLREGERTKKKKKMLMQTIEMESGRNNKNQTRNTETVRVRVRLLSREAPSVPKRLSASEAPLQQQQRCHSNCIQAMTLGMALTNRRLSTPSSAAPLDVEAVLTMTQTIKVMPPNSQGDDRLYLYCLHKSHVFT